MATVSTIRGLGILMKRLKKSELTGDTKKMFRALLCVLRHSALRGDKIRVS